MCNALWFVQKLYGGKIYQKKNYERLYFDFFQVS
jgi:hypothetical protein